MPVNPTTNETQLTLIQEFDLKVGKSLVGALPLRVSDDWVSNGVWAVKRRRVSNQTIFTCQCCLHRDTGQHFLTPFEDYAVEALFPVDAVMERWVKTEHIIETAGVDYVRYLSDAGQVMYLRRDYAESLGLTYVYGDTPERGVWDARDLDDMSIVIPGHREPQNIRLQLAELLEASTVSNHVEPSLPREDWTINVDGTDYRATFTPNWTDSTHYVVVYTGGSQSSVRHIPLAEFPANTNPAIQTLLERIVREVVTGQ